MRVISSQALKRGRFNDYCGAGRDKRSEVGAPKPPKRGMVKI